jgi:hypothetical protein
MRAVAVVVVVGLLGLVGCASSVTVSPTTGSVEPGGSLQFEAVVVGKTDTGVRWTVDEEGGGSISETGLYTAPAAESTFHVRATSVADSALSATAEVTVVSQLQGEVEVKVTPSFAKVRHGETLQLEVAVIGAVSPDVSWTASAGSVSSAGLFTAPETAQVVTVTATLVAAPTKKATATITVTGVVGVSLSPESASLLPGGQQQFQAAVTGTENKAVQWSASTGVITDGGLYTAPGSDGVYTVVATSDEDSMATASAMVVVSPVSISVSPATAALNPEEKLRFAAIVTGTANTVVTWTATGGAVDSSGNYTAGAVPGEYAVTATTSTSPAKSASAVVTVRDVVVSVSPKTVTLQVGTTKQFQVAVTGTANQAVSWSASGGTVSATGLYTAPTTAGAYVVTATSTTNSAKSDSATVTVQYAPLVNVNITNPTTTVTVLQGGTQQYVGAVTGTTDTRLVWSATGGSISASGLFTAPKGQTAAGTYRVTATSVVDSTQSASADVQVPEVAVVVSPKTAALVATNTTNATPTTQLFAATVTGAKDATVTWTVVGGAASGTIAAGGTYKSPTVPGTYTVVATSVADPSKTDTAVVTVAPVPIVVALSPKNPVVALGAQLKFAATVANAQNTNVVWTVADGGVGGQVDSAGNYTAPQTGGQDVVVATSVQDSTKSDRTDVIVCNQSALCTPANVCHLGTIACSATGQTCTDTSNNAPNGKSCGTDLVCNEGSCTSCVEGLACAAPDPCAAGKTSCITGRATCVNAGPNPAKVDGAVCGPDISGVCQAGVCQCVAGQVFAFGDCHPCPDYTGSSLLVNANPAFGADNACCGRSSKVGLGGPCLTIGQAIKNVGGSRWTINVTPDAAGNLSFGETYPIRLSKGVSVSLNAAYAKGVAGQPVVLAEADGLMAQVYGGTLGVDSAGLPSGASEGALVRGALADGGVPWLRVSSVAVMRTTNGVRVDSGGRLELSGGSIDQVDVGVLCRSDSAPGVPASYSGCSAPIRHARLGVLSGRGCAASHSGLIGMDPGANKPCPSPRPIQHGVWVEANGSFVDNGCSWIQVKCADVDGISLRANPNEAVNNPTATLTGATLQYNGCAGLYVEGGRATVSGSTIQNNHFGVYVNSPNSSLDPGLAPVNLNPGPTSSRNRFRCNNATRKEGACSTGAFADKGFDVFNNSGYTIDAANNYWVDSVVPKCLCDSSLANCSCSGWPVGQTTPPDKLSVLNAPLLPSTTGVPSVLTGNNAVDPSPTCP